MTRPSALDLTRYQAVWNAFLVDSATITRTQLTVPFMLASDLADDRLRDVSHMITFTRWQALFRSGTDLKPGDTVVWTGKGTYVVYRVNEPESNAAGLLAEVYQQRRADGSLAIPANAQATFRRTETEESLGPVPVYLEPISPEDFETNNVPAFTYRVIWDPALTYASDGKIPGERDYLTFSEWSGGPTRETLLLRPRRLSYPIPLVIGNVTIPA